MSNFTVYTDGGCMRNPGGRGAYAAIAIDTDTGEIKECKGGYRSTTNNRMEMMAVIEALENLPSGSCIKLHSDSQYVVKTMQGHFKKKKNKDLWNRLKSAMKDKNVTFVWVRGHNNYYYNEQCDQICTEVMSQGDSLQIDVGFEKENHIPCEHENIYPKGAMGVTINIPEQFKKTIERMPVKEYVQKYNVNLSCAKMIETFSFLSRPNFKAYAQIKTGGSDSWSRKRISEMMEMKPELIAEYEYLLSVLGDEKEVLSCIRWYCRGLPLIHAVRKVLVDKEIAENCRR